MVYNNVKVKARQTVAQSNTQTDTLGVVSEVPMGEWNATTQYQKLNKIRYVSVGGSGVTLLAKKANQGVEPFIAQGWQDIWMVENYDGGAVIPNGTYPDMAVGNAIKAENDGSGNNIASQFSEVVSDIQGLREDITNESHFRGMFMSVEALKAAYPTATPNDYAYIVGGNIYIWQNNAWTDSEHPSPNTSVPASNATPLMDGVASAGVESRYARGDHRHPSDTNKVNKSGDTMTGGLALPQIISAEKLGATSGAIIPLPKVPYSLIDPTHETDTYLQNLLKWICANYPNKEHALFIGVANPNSVGTVIIQIYDTGKNNNGLPEYSEGIYQNLSGNLVEFGTANYNWFYRDVYASGSSLPSSSLLEAYPVGSIYMSINPTSPASILGGSWAAINNSYYLRSVTSGYAGAGEYREAGLPNIEGHVDGVIINDGYTSYSGAFTRLLSANAGPRNDGSLSVKTYDLLFKASNTNTLYGNSDTVSPKSYGVYMWRRIA